MKTCRTCKVEKGESEEYFEILPKGKLNNECRLCRAKYCHARYTRNKGIKRICSSCGDVVKFFQGNFCGGCIAEKHPSKRCGDCNETKPRYEFPRHAGVKDGMRAYCRPCNNVRTLKRRKRITKINTFNPVEKANLVCAKCNKQGTEKNFARNASRKTGFDSWCKTCRTSYNKKRHKCKPKYCKKCKIEVGKKEMFCKDCTPQEGNKRCTTCFVEKLAENFSRNWAKHDSLMSVCKKCRSDYAKRWNAGKIEKRKQKKLEDPNFKEGENISLFEGVSSEDMAWMNSFK